MDPGFLDNGNVKHATGKGAAQGSRGQLTVVEVGLKGPECHRVPIGRSQVTPSRDRDALFLPSLTSRPDRK